MTSGQSVAAWLVPVLVVPTGVIGVWALLTYLTGRHSVENASYKVLRRLSGGSGRVELRRYSPSLAATVDVAGEASLTKAQSRGFREVARYIFGANRGASGAPVPVAMTSPVVSQALPSKAGSPAFDTTTPPLHRISFIMPSAFASLADLPTPSSDAVRLVSIPARNELVESRCGLYPDASARDEAAARLADIARREGLAIKQDAAVSVYNFDPPWALPWMRLSEVGLAVEDDVRHEDLAGKTLESE